MSSYGRHQNRSSYHGSVKENRSLEEFKKDDSPVFGIFEDEPSEIVGSRATAVVKLNEALGRAKGAEHFDRRSIQFSNETAESFDVSIEQLGSFGRKFSEHWQRSILPDGKYVWKRTSVSHS